jgi:small-conductance mechanosensitive channel
MTPVLAPQEFGTLVEKLLQRTALIELGLVVACLLVAGVVAWVLRSRSANPAGPLYGSRLVDGVLFPVLSLVLAFAAYRTLLWANFPVAVLRLALPILSSLVVIRLAVRVLQAAFPGARFMRTIERSISWIAWLLVVMWLTGLLPLVMDELGQVRWRVGSAQISLRGLIEGGISAIVVLMVALWISSALESRLLRGATDDLSVRKIAANALRSLLLFIGLMFALSAAGIDLTALGVLGGAVGVGIGFGLQKLASNYISGFVILAERSVRIGDTVKVDNFEGRITDINTRYTVIRAPNGRQSIVPNEMLIIQRVENSSQADARMALGTTVQVVYGTDLDVLMPRLAQAVKEVPGVLGDPAPAVHLQAFTADGFELAVAFSVAGEAEQGPVRSRVNLALLRTLDAMGVEIPFAHRWRSSVQPAQ